MMECRNFTALEIAEIVQGQMIGDGNKTVSSIKFPDEAKNSDLVIAHRKRDILLTEAEVILTKPLFINTDKTLIYCSDNIGLVIQTLIKAFIHKGIYKDYSKINGYKERINDVYFGENVKIGENTIIDPMTFISSGTVIGKDCYIGSNVHIGADVIIGDGVKVYSGARVGADSFYHNAIDKYHHFCGVGTVKIGNGVEVGYNTVIQRGTLSDTKIGENTILGNLIDVGHDVKIGANCKIVSQTGIAGNVRIGNFTHIYGQVGITNNVTIGNYAVVKGKSLVTKNIGDNKIVSGMFGRESAEENRLQAMIRRLAKKERNE